MYGTISTGNASSMRWQSIGGITSRASTFLDAVRATHRRRALGAIRVLDRRRLERRQRARRDRAAGERELHAARLEVAARQLELARRAIERADDVARQVEIANLLVGDERMADVEPAQVKVSGHAARRSCRRRRGTSCRPTSFDSRRRRSARGSARADRAETSRLRDRSRRCLDPDRASPFAVHSCPGTPPYPPARSIAY